MSHTVAARHRPETALRILKRVVSNAVVLQGARGEAADVARVLLERVARDNDF